VPYLTPAPFNPPRAKDVIVDDTQVFMESATADASGNLYVGSFKGNIYRALPGSGTAIAWIRPDETNKLASVLGVLADERSGTLWACSVPIGKPGQVSALAAFDLKSGVFKARYELPAPASACNDVALDKDGAAFIAETSNGRIFVLRPGGKDLSLLVEDKALLAGVDGIAFSEDGTLYVNNVRQNTMLRVNRRDDGRFAGLTTLTVSMPLNGPDGLRSIGGNRFLQAEGRRPHQPAHDRGRCRHDESVEGRHGWRTGRHPHRSHGLCGREQGPLPVRPDVEGQGSGRVRAAGRANGGDSMRTAMIALAGAAMLAAMPAQAQSDSDEIAALSLRVQRLEEAGRQENCSVPSASMSIAACGTMRPICSPTTARSRSAWTASMSARRASAIICKGCMAARTVSSTASSTSG
jgi:hypothetical protein